MHQTWLFPTQFEFFDLGDGQTGMDILLAETDPALVVFELDLFWAALAGVDIPALFRANPGRFKMCHVKDLAAAERPKKAEFGQQAPDIVQAQLHAEKLGAVEPVDGLFVVHSGEGAEKVTLP